MNATPPPKGVRVHPQILLSRMAIFLGRASSSSISPSSSCLDVSLLSFPPPRNLNFSNTKHPYLRLTNGSTTFAPQLPWRTTLSRTWRASWNAKKNHQQACSAEEETQIKTLPHIVLQVALWILAGIYVFWLFLLPYAPGDPIWAIKPYTISMLVDLSLNFFFILPAANAVGLHFMEAPIIHPTVEALFNFVIGWTVMFGPLLFTDRRRENYKGSLEVLWLLQMFLTNTLLIPYMALRLNPASVEQLPYSSPKIKLDMSGVRTILVAGARVLALIGGAVGLTSLLWFLIGRPDEGFGGILDRWTFFLEYLDNDRPGYAFIWDICLYSVFQPWLIGENLSNVEDDKLEQVKTLRFIPYIGLIAYLWGTTRE